MPTTHTWHRLRGGIRNRIAILAMLAVLVGCAAQGDRDGDNAEAAPSTATLPTETIPPEGEMPPECADPDFSVENPEICGDAPLSAPPEVPVEQGVEWSDGMTARIVSVTGRPYDGDPSAGDLMLSFSWELTNTGDIEIPLGDEMSFPAEAAFLAVVYYGENYTESDGYLPNEGAACSSDLPQRLVPGSSTECLADHLVPTDYGELRAEVWHNGEMIVLTGIESVVGG